MRRLSLAWLLAAAGCASPWTQGLSEAEASAVRSDALDVLVAEWPPARTAAAEGSPELEAELRRRGYAVGAGGESVDLAVSRVGDLEWWRVGIAVDGAWRADRLYGRTPSGELRPASGWTIRARRRMPWPAAVPAPAPAAPAAPEEEPEPAEGSAADAAAQPSAESAAGSAPAGNPPAESPDAAPEAEAAPPASCERLSLRVGSLRAQVSEAVADCGYRVAGWPGDEWNHHDWVVRRAWSAPARGIEGVLEALRAEFGLIGRISGGEVDFEVARP